MDQDRTDRAWAKTASETLADGGILMPPELIFQGMRVCVVEGHPNPRSGVLAKLGISHAAFMRTINGRGAPVLDEPFPDAEASLDRLTDMGYRIGLIADQATKEARARLVWTGLLDKFEVAVFPEEAGYAKPDEDIFDLALRMADCRPDRSIMIGDRLDHDIYPAKSIGMGTIWVKRGPFGLVFPIRWQETPDVSVDSLEAVAELLKR